MSVSVGVMEERKCAGSMLRAVTNMKELCAVEGKEEGNFLCSCYMNVDDY